MIILLGGSSAKGSLGLAAGFGASSAAGVAGAAAAAGAVGFAASLGFLSSFAGAAVTISISSTGPGLSPRLPNGTTTTDGGYDLLHYTNGSQLF